jgi:peptidoglycan hydrolase CwlO-like protein
MDILALLQTIQKDWVILVFVFGLGAAWWQGKIWFKRVNDTLDRVGTDHSEQNSSLEKLHTKVDNLDNRVTSIETKVNEIHEELHIQEIKLAILESNSAKRASR